MSAPTDPVWLARQSELTLARLLPRLEVHFAEAGGEAWTTFVARLQRHFPRLFRLLLHLYGSRYDFFYHLEQILASAAEAALNRPLELRELDRVREADPRWFQSRHMLGGVCYVDLFAGNLEGIRDRIPYFRELGLTYLHLMPLFERPAGENDGGYAVSSYREVWSPLGTMAQLESLAADLRANGISLVVDFVFNHTSNEHAWAQAAVAGDEEHRDFYFMFPDRTLPDQYERTLREIFPEQRNGSFTWQPGIKRWVWTTFYSYQWDLNYANPAVFKAMMEEMLFLANAGVEILRLDAVAFIWKQMGTSCENLPEAHMLIQAFNAVARMAAPSLTFKSEAIVHPDDVVSYISPEECQVSYNPLLMALLWESLATREVKLLQASLSHRFKLPDGTAWVNYVRSHDDIGWTFDDGDAGRVGIKGYDHRQFLNAFYTGRFAGSFARGLPFQENPRTGDCRISGTCASLAGLEKAVVEHSARREEDIELALRRILLIHSVILSAGGIPLIYLGDEIGTLNDYRYREDPSKADDSRWVHRPFASPSRYERRDDLVTLEARVYLPLRHLIQVRKETPALGGGELQVFATGNGHVFGCVRQHAGARLLVLANFCEQRQTLNPNVVRTQGLSYAFRDLVSGEDVRLGDQFVLEPYQYVWLAAR